jgi:hypothetical protein
MTERRVCVTAREDGMAELWALLPAEGAAAVMTAVDALASAIPADDTRTADQHRADAPRRPRHRRPARPAAAPRARHAASGASQRRAVHPARPRRPTGRTRRARTHPSLGRPPIAADPTGTWHRLITDPTGRLIDYGTTTYRPPADLTRFVTARDQTCTFPGCTRPARRCDLDHGIPASAGDATSADNLAVLCR